jgi:hypothetical protein
MPGHNTIHVESSSVHELGRKKLHHLEVRLISAIVRVSPLGISYSQTIARFEICWKFGGFIR